ncbi:MAG: DUF262 domain-containing protein [Atopobiaceae bacterium]|nr:DUF262 domain-containing protein [Atopobiaceae bacterium]
MSASLTNVSEFLSVSDWYYVVPVYQRDYIWDEPECRQLWSDIREVMSGKRDNHFIGSVICKNSEDGTRSTVIIDGQQRITTLLLLVRAVIEFEPDEKAKRRYAERYLVNRNADDDGERLRLRPVEDDYSAFEKIMRWELPVRDDSFTEREQQSFVYGNYVLLRKLVGTDIDSQIVTLDQIMDAIENLLLIRIKLGKENPQLIFESINSTGKKLENYDLIRNYILMSLPYDQQVDMYLRYWRSIERNVCSDGRGKDALGTFLLFWMYLKRRTNDYSKNGRKGKLSDKCLYPAYKSFFDTIRESFGSLDATLGDMLAWSETFDAVQSHVFHGDLAGFGDVCKALIEKCQLSLSVVILMWAYRGYCDGRWNADALAGMSRAFLNYAVRRIVSVNGNSRGRGVDAQTVCLMMQRFEDNYIKGDDPVDVFWRCLTSFTGIASSFVNDVNFTEGLSRPDFYNKRDESLVWYMLYELNASKSEKPPLRSAFVTIEHVMPKTITKKWRRSLIGTSSDLELDYAKHVHMLGNLVLTTASDELRGKSFAEKRIVYGKSSFADTRDFVKHFNWGFKDIEERTREMAREACKVWPLPERYAVKGVASEKSWYRFSTDYDLFDRCNPVEISIYDDRRSCTSWSSLLIRVLQGVHDFDENLFESCVLDFANRRTELVSKDAHQFRRNMRMVGTDYYVNTDRNKKTLYNWCGEFLALCSERSGMDMVSEVMFRIRRKST